MLLRDTNNIPIQDWKLAAAPSIPADYTNDKVIMIYGRRSGGTVNAWNELGTTQTTSGFGIDTQDNPISLYSAENVKNVANGAGAQRIRVTGVDLAGDQQTLDVNTNGNSSTSSNVNIRAVNMMEVIRTGADRHVTGDFISDRRSGHHRATLEVRDAHSWQGYYIVPNGQTIYLNSVHVSAAIDDDAKSVDVRMSVRRTDGVDIELGRTKLTRFSPVNNINLPIYVGIEEGEMFFLDYRPSASGITVRANASAYVDRGAADRL